MEALRTSESSKTFARVAKLADGAISEHVRLQAAIHLGEIDGISAIQKAEIEHRHIGRVPGLTIVLNSPADDLVDVTPAPVRGLGDVVRRQIGGLHGGYVYGDDVPHPALRRRRAPDEPPEAA
jgi:hypothetical protein